jgi:hypothetical protein
MNNFNFITFKNLSELENNEFYNLECEIDNKEYIKEVHKFNQKYVNKKNINKKNINNKKKIIKSRLLNSLIEIDNSINIFYNEIIDFKKFINFNLECKFKI